MKLRPSVGYQRSWVINPVGSATCHLILLIALLAAIPAAAQTQVLANSEAIADASEPLPDAPSSAAQGGSGSFGKAAGSIARTIGEDELHITKAPFQKDALVWDALVVGATGVLIANDESVLYQVPVSWHSTGR